MKLSIIIVSYNSKYFLSILLESLLRSLKRIDGEIILVDNCSADSTPTFVRNVYASEVREGIIKIIENSENVGFSRANNLGLAHAKGDIIAMINPDIVVEEDTFEKILSKFQSHPQISALAPRIMNPDGTFAIDSRHAIPDPKIAFWKAIGFQKLFPRHRIFGQYNLTYLDESLEIDIPALSGSFMVFKREVLEKLNGLDEEFFMYCEDIDLCKRIQDIGGIIRYFPDIRVLHFKGESTTKQDYNYVKTFNQSMLLFYHKHFSQKLNVWWNIIIKMGVWSRGLLIFIKNNLSKWWHFIIPLLLFSGWSLVLTLTPFQVLTGIIVYIILFNLVYPSDMNHLKFLSTLLSLSVTAVLILTMLVKSLPDSVMEWLIVSFSFIFSLFLLNVGTGFDDKEKYYSGFLAELIVRYHGEFSSILRKFLQGKIVITEINTLEEIDEKLSPPAEKHVIIDIRNSLKTCFNIMEKYPGVNYLFWNPDEAIVVGDNFHLNLNETGNTNSESIKCKIWFLIMEKLWLPFIDVKQKWKIKSNKKYNKRNSKKEVQRILKDFISSKLKCTEKLAYLWLYLQLLKR